MMNANIVSPRNIHGRVLKRESRYLPAMRAKIIGPAIQLETSVNISTAGSHQATLFSCFGLSDTKNKAEVALVEYIKKKLVTQNIDYI